MKSPIKSPIKSKTRKSLFAIGAFVLVLTSAGFASGGTGRTRSYFGTYRASYDRAPSLRPLLALADFLLNPVLETLGPFEPIWMQVEPGMNMRLDPYDFVSRKLLETGIWEPGSTMAVSEQLFPGATFIDIGAHIGYYTLKAANKVGPNGHVISIEPNPQTLPKLRENIQANDGRAVTVWPVACSSTESTLQLYAAPESNTGESSLSKDNASQESAATAAYSVRARPLDAIISEARLTRVDVIKLDVEGAELEVLKGAVKTLDEFRPVLIVEIVPKQLASMGTSVEEVTQFLAAHGYKESRQLGDANVEFVATKAAAGGVLGSRK